MDEETNQQDQEQSHDAGKEKMCCEGGMTAEEHRHQTDDGKCCTD